MGGAGFGADLHRADVHRFGRREARQLSRVERREKARERRARPGLFSNTVQEILNFLMAHGVTSVHAAHATTATAAGQDPEDSFFSSGISEIQGLGGQQEPRRLMTRSGSAVRTTFAGIDDRRRNQVLVFCQFRALKPSRASVSPDLLPPRSIFGSRRCWRSSGAAPPRSRPNDVHADLLIHPRASAIRVPSNARISANARRPAPMPSSTAALVRCIASSTRAFFFLHLGLGWPPRP